MSVIKSWLQSILPQSRKITAWLTDSEPVFSSFGNNIYMSDFVNNAIDRVASEISKIDVKSVIQTDENVKVQNDDITRLFRTKPNPLQTASDFLASIEWIRRKYRNCFVYPQFEYINYGGVEYRRLIALYPILISDFDVGVMENGQVWEIRINLSDGTTWTLLYSDLVHLKWRRGCSITKGGGDDNGRVNDKDVLRTITALDKTIQGLPKAIEASLQVRGVYTSKTTIDRDKITAERDDFEKHILSSKTGIVATDLGGDFTPVNIKTADIPKDAMDFLKSVIQERYGISAAIMSGDYNGDQHSAFYQTAIEDFITQFEQAFTHAIFTPNELTRGHRIRAYYSKTAYMSQQNKIELANLATNTGLMTLNQIGDMFGIPPFEGGNRRLQSLNYANVDIVDKYQIKTAKGEVEEIEEENANAEA